MSSSNVYTKKNTSTGSNNTNRKGMSITKYGTTTTKTSSSSSPNTTNAATKILPSAKKLQDQLHDLITRLTITMDHIKNWTNSSNSTTNNNNNEKNEKPSTTDHHQSTTNTTTTMQHVECTTRLIAYIKNILSSIQRVETTISSTENIELRTMLQNVYIPYDLMDLLDYNIMINPDIYVRGLIQEAMGQFIGLQRRKNALQLLSSMMNTKLNEQEQQEKYKQQRLYNSRANNNNNNETIIQPEHTTDTIMNEYNSDIPNNTDNNVNIVSNIDSTKIDTSHDPLNVENNTEIHNNITLTMTDTVHHHVGSKRDRDETTTTTSTNDGEVMVTTSNAAALDGNIEISEQNDNDDNEQQQHKKQKIVN